MITPEQLAVSGSEHGHQAAFFCWCQMNLDKYPQLKWIHSVPNGFHATPKSKATMKSEGLKAGVWDIFLPKCSKAKLPDGSSQHYGMYIEMKVGKNDLTAEQLNFGQAMRNEGYATFVCYSWEQARDAVIKYLEG